jgi:hypothetical protein
MASNAIISPDIRSGLKVAYSPFLDRAKLAGRAAVAQMTDDLRVLTANAGCITEADLELMGWLPAQIAKHGRDATRQARAKSERVS